MASISPKRPCKETHRSHRRQWRTAGKVAAGLDPLGAREMGEDGLLEGTRGLPGRLKEAWVGGRGP